MAKKKISARQEKSLHPTKSKTLDLNKFQFVNLKNDAPIQKHDPSLRLRNKRFIAKALLEALTDGDAEAFKEILRAHLETVNKDDIAEQSGVPRSTVFRMLEPGSNPTLNTVAKVFRGLKLKIG